MVLYKDFLFVRQRFLNLINRQHGTVVIYMELRGVEESWNLLAVFCYIKVMNAEVFAKGFEKCRLLIRFLGQNLENLDENGCPKNQDLVGEGKANSSWICCSYPFRHKTRLHSAERKAKVYGDWARQHFNL